jgi:cellobiose-specific phosphotransferase system component IIC
MAMVGHEMRGSFSLLIGQSTNTVQQTHLGNIWNIEYRIYNNALFTVSILVCVFNSTASNQEENNDKSSPA